MDMEATHIKLTTSNRCTKVLFFDTKKGWELKDYTFKIRTANSVTSENLIPEDVPKLPLFELSEIVSRQMAGEQAYKELSVKRSRLKFSLSHKAKERE